MRPRENRRPIDTQKIGNTLSAGIYLGAMMAMTALLGWLFAGSAGLLGATVACVIFLLNSPRLASGILLKSLGATPLAPGQAPQLYHIVGELSRRAALPAPPVVYYVPSGVANAFATVKGSQPLIAITDGLINALNQRELTAVLAHEISHLRNNDLWILNLSQTFSKVTAMFALAGQILLLLSLPLVFTDGYTFPLVGVMVLMSAPLVDLILQMALSRSREFSADRGAAELTGDPESMVSALQAIERYQGHWFRRFLLSGYGKGPSSLLRSHPNTEERIRRLLDVRKAEPVGRPGPFSPARQRPYLVQMAQGPGHRTVNRPLLFRIGPYDFDTP